jgi:prenyltransferase beta subunit
MNWLTALLAILSVNLVSILAQTPEEKKASIAFLRKLQAEDGGFLPAPAGTAKTPASSSLRATSSALRALKYFGGSPRDAAACTRFVESCFDKTTGGFKDSPGAKPDVFTTAVGIMAVVELKLPAERYSDAVIKYLGTNSQDFEEIRIAAAGLESIQKRAPRADAWLAQITKLRNPDGTFGKGKGQARATGGSLVTVLRLGGKLDQEKTMLNTLKAGQRSDGGFGKEDAEGSDLETSYRVMRAFVMLKQQPNDVAALRGFIAKCRHADGGYGVTPGQPSTVSGTYFASIVLHWLGDK